MTEEGNEDVGLAHTWDLFYIVVGLVGFVFGISGVARVKRGFMHGLGYEVAMWGLIAVGLGALLYGVYCFLDNRAKLSLTSVGLKDHRTGVFIKWEDIRGVRLNVHRTNGVTMMAVMSVKVADGQGEREMEINVGNLDRCERIADLVRERGNEARRAAATSPEALFAILMSEATSDLTSGIPISMTTNKLVKRGLQEKQVAELLRLLTPEGTGRCEKCRLDFHDSVVSCSICGSSISKVSRSG